MRPAHPTIPTTLSLSLDLRRDEDPVPDNGRHQQALHDRLHPIRCATGAFVRSDLLVANKPDEGPACPGPPATIYSDLKTPTGDRLYGPAPANQIDGSPTGYVVARTAALPSGRLGIIRVTEADRTGAKLEPFSLAIGHYGAPPPVDQRAAPALDTGDARTTQAVLARVPRNRSAFSLFTQQTVAAGSPGVDWFELDPEEFPIRRRGRIRGADFESSTPPSRPTAACSTAWPRAATTSFSSTTPPRRRSTRASARPRASMARRGPPRIWRERAVADLSGSCGHGPAAVRPWGAPRPHPIRCRAKFGQYPHPMAPPSADEHEGLARAHLSNHAMTAARANSMRLIRRPCAAGELGPWRRPWPGTWRSGSGTRRRMTSPAPGCGPWRPAPAASPASEPNRPRLSFRSSSRSKAAWPAQVTFSCRRSRWRSMRLLSTVL